MLEIISAQTAVIEEAAPLLNIYTATRHARSKVLSPRESYEDKHVKNHTSLSFIRKSILPKRKDSWAESGGYDCRIGDGRSCVERNCAA